MLRIRYITKLQNFIVIMTNNTTIQVIDSWDLTSIGIIAELKHSFNGLQSGIIIKSQSTGNEWRIENRILYNHTFSKQRIFLNETTTQSFLSFGSMEKQIVSAKNILDKEDNNIFHYQLQPIGHKSKPLKDEILVEKSIHKFD